MKILYSKTHEWVMVDGNKCKVGLSDYAQKELGDLVFINLPEVGASLKAGDVLCDVESVKAVSDMYCPVTGVITAINEELESSPEMINKDPLGAWICEFEIEGLPSLMDEAAYKNYIKD